MTGFDISSSDEGVLAGSDSKWIENETITIYPTSGEANIANITAVDENSDPITLTHITPADPGEGEYWTFTMPASNVTITATQGS